jgi:transposase-like protein
MALQIVATERTEVTKLVCPECGEKVKQVGLRKDSTIEGLSFKCKRCGRYFEVKTTKELNKA